jgi:nucleoside-diphosphate-sugar epimerase
VIVAVTGATGAVGRFIVARLVEEHATVRAWRRSTSDLSGLPEGIDWLEGDLGSPHAAAALVEGAEMLVHCALDHEPGRYRGGEGADVAHHLRVNVGGGLALLGAARSAGVRRCVVLSSRAVFGREAPARINDEERPRPDTLYGAGKAALEAFVEAWGHDGWAIAALRPTGVYGLTTPARKSKWFDLVTAALCSEAVPSRAGTEVHGRDVADAVWRLLQAPAEQVARAHVQLQRPRRLHA